MVLPRPAAPETPTPADAPDGQPARRLWRWARRRGATMMEYLVCLSFIVAVCVLAIQHVGGVTGTMLKNDATQIPSGASGS